MSEALRHEIEETMLAAERSKMQKKLEVERQKFRDAYDKRVAEVEKEAAEKMREEVEMELKKARQAAQLAEERKQKAQEEILEMNKMITSLKERDVERELEMQKKLQAAEEAMTEKIRKQAEDEQRLKIAEKDKQLADVMKANEELRRKLQQGSQQTQGEVLELELEESLRSAFVHDEINEVPKGIRGADVVQKVRDQQGRAAGTMVWESKNTKAFSPGWISKLKEDQRALTADVAILITSTMPDGIKHFGYMDGVWVTDWESVIGLATALRFNLLSLGRARRAAVGKEEKMEILYSYLSGTEFRQRVEAIVEGFNGMQQELETEKRWFARKWAKQEKQIRLVMDNTQGMYGDLQGMMGASLPEIGALLLEEGEGE